MDEVQDFIRETQRSIVPVDREGRTFYELTVKQEYFEDNVKNMIETFTRQVEQIEGVLADMDNKVNQAKDEAHQQVQVMHSQVLQDLAMTDEEVLRKWKEECKRKQDWLENIESFEADAVKAIEAQMQQLKQQLETEYDKSKRAKEIWGAALNGSR